MLKLFARLRAFVINVLFPLECLGCRCEGYSICPDCLRRLGTGCEERLTIPELDRIFIAGNYDDPLLSEAIKKFKYHSMAALGKPLADFLTSYWSGIISLSSIDKAVIPGYPALGNNYIVIPVPLSAKRRRWRGFNQAEILARIFATDFGYVLSLELKRTKHSRPQASSGASQRWKNVHGAFDWKGDDLSGKDIILIDDVATTGATLNAAALALRDAGAKKIYGLVLARG